MQTTLQRTKKETMKYLITISCKPSKEKTEELANILTELTENRAVVAAHLEIGREHIHALIETKSPIHLNEVKDEEAVKNYLARHDYIVEGDN